MMNRCDHGNYIPQGDTKSPNCTGCTPPSVGILKVNRHRKLDVIIPERMLDSADYFEQPVTDRLADAFNMQMEMA